MKPFTSLLKRTPSSADPVSPESIDPGVEVGLQIVHGQLPGGLMPIVAVAELPFREAVTMALWAVVTEPTVAVKLAPVDPAGTVTLDGTVKKALLSEIMTTAPPAEGAEDSVIVQFADPPDTTVEGEHCRFETVGRTGVVTVIVPPAPVIVAALPSGSAPMTPLSGRES